MTRLRLVAQVVMAALIVARGCSLPAPQSVPVAGNASLVPVDPTSQNVSAVGCRNHPGGGNCPEYAPCCLNGYCSDDPRYCSVGCEAKNSWKETSCFPKAYCSNVREEFDKPRLASAATFNGNPNDYDFTTDYNPSSVTVQDSALKITMRLDRVLNAYGRPQGLGSVVSTTRYMQYGKVTARIKTGSTSPGVVSAFIIRNEDPGDEVDFEIVGRDPTKAQTNFYYNTPPGMKTGMIDYSNSRKEPLNANTAMDFHEYEIEWMPDYLLWKVDGTVVRSVLRNETKDVVDALGAPVIDQATGQHVKRYPSTPARIQFGIWDGGQGSQGTASWAGTPTNWSEPDQSYEFQVDYVDIQCYYTGNTTSTWPPPGYGPTKIHDGPYSTPGLDGGRHPVVDESFYNEETPSLHPYVPFYKNFRLMAPVGCILGVALIVVATIEINKRRRLANIRWQ